jgi:hypothetical protein
MKRRVTIKKRLIAQRGACASKCAVRDDGGTSRSTSFTGDLGHSRVGIVTMEGPFANDSMLQHVHQAPAVKRARIVRYGVIAVIFI